MDLTAKPQVTGNLDLTATGLTPTVTDPIILKQRAEKYSFALGDLSPGESALEELVASGNERDLRTQASIADFEDKKETARSMIPQAVGELTGEDIGDVEYLSALASPQIIPPDIIFEHKFSENAVNVLQSLDENEARQAEEQAQPTVAESYYKSVQDLSTNKQTAFKLAEDWAQKTGQMGWGDYAFFTGLQLAPFLQWANFSSRENEARFEFQGQSILAQVEKLYKLPPDQFKIQAEAELTRLAEFNPLDADKFAQALVSYGSTDADLDNFFGAVDILSLGTGKVAKAITLPLTTSRMKTVAKAITKKQTTIPDVLADAGHIEDAGEAAAREVVSRRFIPEGAPEAEAANVSALVKQVPALINPKYFTTNSAKFASNYTERLTTLAEKNIAKLSEAVTGVLRPATLPRQALDVAFDTAEAEYKKTYGKLSDNILSIERIQPDQTVTGTGKAVIRWGKDGGKAMYQTWSGALQAAVKRYRLKDYEIKKLAEDQYVIETTIDISESRPEVFDALLSTDNKSGPPSNWQWLRSFMGAKEHVSDFQAQQRAAAAHGTTHMGEILSSVWRPVLEKLSKNARDDLDKIMTINRDSLRVPGDPDTRGMFYENLSELNQAYLQHIGRPMTIEDAEAYFTARQMSDFDWFLRSVNEAKAKIRRGAMNHEVRIVSQETGKAEPIEVEAIKLEKLPVNSRDDAKVLIQVEGEKTATIVSLSDLARDIPNTERLQKLTTKGEGNYIVLQVYDQAKRDLNDLTGYKQPISYLVVKSSRPSAIKLSNQVPWRPGFHVEYNNNWYIKQGQFAWNKGRRAHTGDITLLGIRTEKEGKQLLQHISEAQRLYKSKDSTLEAYLTKNTPWDLKEFRAIMKEFSEDTPFVLARDGRTSADGSSLTSSGKTMKELYGEFDNLILSPHNPASQASREFMGEKDGMLKKAVRLGTQLDPIWKLEDADMLSPLATQTRAMGRLMRSIGYEDYQIGAVNSFVAEFGKALKYKGETVSPQQLQRNPLFYFKHGVIEHPDKSYQQQATQIKKAIEDLVGYPTQFSLAMDDFRMKLSEGILGEYIPEKTMPFLRDPLRYSRAAVSHMKLGMFNPVQLFLQQATHANIAFISPVHGTKQIPATIMMRLLSLTEDEATIQSFAQKAAKLGTGWTPEMFTESLKGFNKSGFGVIGGEYAWRNDISDPKIFKGRVGKFLDKGYLFFNHAERNVRMAAWNTSYSEYVTATKRANRLNDADFRKILVRAQDLSGNMSRDASAFWQRGVSGSFTQFYAYTARITELLVGKRLTLAEKARLGGGLSLLYGFPVLGGLGLAMETGDVGYALSSLNPFDEDLRTYALEQGYNIDESTWGNINNGLASSLLYLMTGEHFDVSARYSPFNLEVTSNWRRNIQEHNPLTAILVTSLGASGSVIRDVITSLYPVSKDLYQMMAEGEDTQLLMDDFFNATREISSMNTAYKIYTAIQGGLYLSKKGTLIAKQDAENADERIIEALLGIQPYDETDTFRLITSTANSRKVRQDVLKEMKKYGNYYSQALQEGDYSAMQQYINRIEALMLTFPANERPGVWEQLFNQTELRENVWKQFTKQGSEEQRIKREQLRIQRNQ